MASGDALILEHRRWAATLAVATVRNRLLPLDHDDAVSAAMVALVVCARRWKPGPATFRTYAFRRIVGAVYDELRHDRWWSHGGRDAMGSYLRPLPLSAPVADGATVADTVAEREHGYDHAETTTDLEAIFTGRDRTILQLLAHGLTLAQVGARLGVTESRVCQIRRAARQEFACSG